MTTTVIPPETPAAPPPTPWAEACFALADVFGFDESDRAVMLAAYEDGMARRAAMQALRAGEPGVELLRGRPIDWAHDGTERRGQDTPGYRCPTCRDALFVRRDVRTEDGDFGQAVPCRCTVEHPAARAEAIRRRVAQSGLEPGLRHCTLDNFEPIKGTQSAWQAAQQFVAWVQQGGDPLWVAFYGPPGTGKSHLVAALVQAAALTRDVLWASVPDFLRECKAPGEVPSGTGGATTIRDFALDGPLTAAAISAPVLALDEFGSAGEGTWAREKLELILDKRWANRLPTLLAITLEPKELAKWSPRMDDRLADRSLVRSVVLTGGSYRRRLERKDEGAA